jgi:hypothetical protein
MKHLLTGFSLMGAFALIAVAVGCASYEVQIKESLLSEAGFQTWTPTTQEQWAMFNRVAPYKLERNTINGKALYSYADRRKGVVYIGWGKAYRRYKQLVIKVRNRERPTAIGF